MWIALVIAASCWAQASEASTPARAEQGSLVVKSVAQKLQMRRYLDAHILAEASLATVHDDESAHELQLLNSLALIELDDRNHARLILQHTRTAAPLPKQRLRAQQLLALSYLKDQDAPGLAAKLTELPPESALRLRVLAHPNDDQVALKLQATSPPAFLAQLNSTRDGYMQALGHRSPWFAGALSAVIPGAGQAYAGSWQAAGLALLLNAVFIGATVELARNDLPFTAVASGLAASFFYVGNIVNAAQLAAQGNRARAQPHYESLERLLLPEAYPGP